MPYILTLEVEQGPQAGKRFAVPDQGATMGRNPRADIHLDDDECSREHAIISREGDHFLVRDTGSTNGIFLNGQKIQQLQRLQNGDRLRLGLTVMKVDLQTVAGGAETHIRSTPIGPMLASGSDGDPDIATVATDRDKVRAQGDASPRPVKATGKTIVAGLILLVVLAGIWWLLLPSGPADTGATDMLGAAPTESPPPQQDTDQRVNVSGPQDAPIAETIGEDVPDADAQPVPQPDMAVLPEFPGTVDEDDDFLPEMATPAPDAAEEEVEAIDEWGAQPPEPDAEAVAEVEPAEPPEPGTADFLWLASTPSGATVELDGEAKGQTPLLLERLPEGRHQVRFLLPYHEPLSKFLVIPGSGEKQQVELRQLNGTCRLTSSPPGAFVQRGPQYLGQTPLILHDIPEGVHPVQLVHPGYKPVSIKVTINEMRPTRSHIDLVPNTGAIRLVTIPGEVEIQVDDLPKGKTTPGAEATGQSLPYRLTGFTPGTHRVKAVWQGIASPVVNAEVSAGGESDLRLIVYVPNLELTLDNQQTTTLMKVGETDDALFVITPKLDPVRLSKERIASSRDIPLDEARQLLQQGDAPR